MQKYARLINEEHKICEVGLGTDKQAYVSAGMSLQDVEQAWDGSWYLAGYAPKQPEPTVEEKVARLEAETGLTRAVRELVLADNSGVSDYVRAKAQEIESLANLLRGGPEASAPAESQKEEE